MMVVCTRARTTRRNIGGLHCIWDPHPHFQLELNCRLVQVWWEVSVYLSQKHSWGRGSSAFLQRKCHFITFQGHVLMIKFVIKDI